MLWGQSTEELTGVVGFAFWDKNKTHGFCLEQVTGAVESSRLTWAPSSVVERGSVKDKFISGVDRKTLMLVVSMLSYCDFMVHKWALGKGSPVFLTCQNM